jgi:ABC-2 type transport system permease protein
MRSLAKLIWVEFKLYLRQPSAAFFALLFPLLLLIMFGSIYGNKPNPFFGGHGMVDVSTPAYIAIILGSTGFMSISIVVSTYRERGILRRYRATPLRPTAIIGSQVTVNLVMTLAGTAILVAGARFIYGMRFAGSVFAVLIGLTLSALSFFAVGFVVASVSKTSRVAQTLAMILYFPNIFLSGATVPKEIFPPVMRTISKVLPMTHVVNLLQGLWLGQPWSAHVLEVGVLAGLLVAGTFVSAKTFRWD